MTASRSSYAQAVRLAPRGEKKSQHVTSSVELRQPRIPVGNSKNVVMALDGASGSCSSAAGLAAYTKIILTLWTKVMAY